MNEKKWIPVKERLPEPGMMCLVVVKMKYDFEKEYEREIDVAEVVEGEGYIDGRYNTWVDWQEGQEYIHVTHWMPLPGLPEEEEAE